MGRNITRTARGRGGGLLVKASVKSYVSRTKKNINEAAEAGSPFSVDYDSSPPAGYRSPFVNLMS